eukprot:TRINITY_DN36161_c0_g1_i1.p1 TRINITY_DN36161_c0_g1~~TRINITY_DN36161_c0_g1_i1.p1  ORF type:complete len:145 (+),score=9.34 TRINITY_DN36161_c0_g1_i1:431-865(+)
MRAVAFLAAATFAESIGLAPFTPNEIAGLAFGTGLLALAWSAPKFDNYVAVSQRRALGLCEQCGGVKKLPCRACKGQGLRKNALAMGTPSNVNCTFCRGSGQLPCPVCEIGGSSSGRSSSRSIVNGESSSNTSAGSTSGSVTKS